MAFMGESCLKCGGKTIILSSMNKRLCVDCKDYSDWLLKPRQKSVLIEGAVGGSDNNKPQGHER